MAYIKKDFIANLLERADIVDVINSRIHLKKSGANYSACCPFHNEKTPSFSVNQRKQFFNCFGCHIAGNAIKFIQEYDHLDFPEAVEEVASIVGIDVEYEESSADFSKKDKPTFSIDPYSLLEDAAKLFKSELPKHKEAVDYLTNRGITKETIEKYGIGYAPNSFDFIKKYVGLNDPLRLKTMYEISLLSEKEEGSENYYDMYRNRIMIPIRNRKGRIIGFGGRVLDNSKPKYINSRESSVFQKGYELFNLDSVRMLPRDQLDSIIITEGYMDVIALDQHGVHNAVASLGTATTENQLSLLFKQTDKIIFCYDGDAAGQHAAWRALTLVLPVVADGKELSFCFLPDDHDPDSYVRQYGAEAFKKYANEATPLSSFLIQGLITSKNLDITNENSKTVFLSAVKELTSSMPNAPIIQEQIIQKASLTINWPVQRVSELIKSKVDSNVQRITPNEQVVQQAKSIAPTTLRMLVALILQNPHLVSEIPEWKELNQLLQTFTDSKNRIVADLVNKVLAKPEIKTGALVEMYRDTPFEKLMNYLAAIELNDSDTIYNLSVLDMLELIKRLLLEGVDKRRKELQLKSTQNAGKGLSSEELVEFTMLQRVFICNIK